ncbi:platelet endothelial aggregation receptor 1 [Electrophorus electricus]|uniref:platelet endothelial aggregation receptor 1 n=1 Tax=Electrophorus electricus TaxID=8005 RepID=UPI0015CFAC5C|nr:platelet endothelial aggregation receptor 1 [Electrophorus electricus]
MREAASKTWAALLWWLLVPGPRNTVGLNATRGHPGQFFCRPGYYCPEGGKTAVPCPRGTFGPSSWATDTRDCISCPPYHYAPREGLAACLPCGPRAQQPLPAQDKCVCLREGQVFQASDGQCHCALGYRATQMEDGCQLKVYELCKDGSVRDQRGECLSSGQWERLCSLQVCASPERYEGYDASLGLCVCTDPAWHEPTRSECVGGCRDRSTPPLLLVCSAPELHLLYTASNSQV